MEVIKVIRRDSQAKANHLRRNGIVPCCVYGGNLKESISIQMNNRDAKRLFRTKREGSKVALDLDGHIIPTQIKEKRIRLNGDVEHFSFEALSADKRVNSVAHIFLKNTDLVPGNLAQLLFEVPFSSLPEDMIDTVTIDIAGLPSGTVLTINDIPEFQSDKIDLQIDRNSMVLRIAERKRSTSYEAQTQQ